MAAAHLSDAIFSPNDDDEQFFDLYSAKVLYEKMLNSWYNSNMFVTYMKDIMASENTLKYDQEGLAGRRQAYNDKGSVRKLLQSDIRNHKVEWSHMTSTADPWAVSDRESEDGGCTVAEGLTF